MSLYPLQIDLQLRVHGFYLAKYVLEWRQEFELALDKVNSLFEEILLGKTKFGVVVGKLGPCSCVIAVCIPFVDKILIDFVGPLYLCIQFHHFILFTNKKYQRTNVIR